MFNLSLNNWEKISGNNTAKEITQQPGVWKKQFQHFSKYFSEINTFIQQILEQHSRVRVIMTGAGTSAFIGDILLPILRKEHKGKLYFESIATTDIVSNPDNYFIKDEPTILVSFARSGNSPESIATVNLGKQTIENFYQINITCNELGSLSEDTRDDPDSLTILLPAETHDKGFAMTSSFTTMMLTAYLMFTSNGKNSENQIKHLITCGNSMINNIGDIVDDILNVDLERLVYLGSGAFGQLAHEAALKMLELSAGKIVAMHESSLGFRHGPKSVLNNNTIIIMFFSSDSYTRKYDFDMLEELISEDVKVVVIQENEDKEVEKLATWSVALHEENKFDSELYLSLLFIVFAQTLALKKSVQLGITPDNPSPDGIVNRVVQGVKIYPKELV
ncbi:SIS domain-containing protein [Aquibacillus halophilus]|uniref:SIS domain-containing protein n=1 Tax=Aquibacillus halophilus TaxID=930132 RepID=A0A6A8DDI4_9BACI|nr:SIS domain-containing protein [Aquibacillus halophilus]MRH43300.1 SIS domain-containing protein [Aquibacillus halophilus]